MTPIETALLDSIALSEIAKTAGVSVAVAMTIAAQLAELPAAQAIRICSSAQHLYAKRRTGQR